MGNYVLTHEQEDDFMFANNGQIFGEWLKVSLPIWEDAAKSARRGALLQRIPNFSDDMINELILTAGLRIKEL